MSITGVDLGAWISIYCGFTLLRSAIVPGRHEDARFGGSRTRALAGWILLASGLLILGAVVLRHILREV